MCLHTLLMLRISNGAASKDVMSPTNDVKLQKKWEGKENKIDRQKKHKNHNPKSPK